MEGSAGKCYDCFVESENSIREGAEVELVIRDVTEGKRKYESRYVRAEVISADRADADSNLLILRSRNGELLGKQWRIKLLKELGPFKEI
jgi:hypothetical protein